MAINFPSSPTEGQTFTSGNITYTYTNSSWSANVSADRLISLTGDASGSGTTSIALTLANSGVTAGTYTKITVDAKGRATVGASLSSGDVTTALGFTPYNSTNPSGYITSSSVGTGTLTLTIGVGNTNTAIVNISGTGFNANSSTNSNYQFNVGPALNNLPTAMTGATTGFLKKTAQDTYSIDTNTYLTANQSITVSGDASGSGTTSISLTLANSGVTAGTYKSVTVDAKGRVTSGTNPTTLSGYGITDAQPLDADLTSIAGLAGTSGLLKKTAADTWTLDTSTYLTSYTETDPVFSAHPAASVTVQNIIDWNTAYGWGNHASAGYLTSSAIGTTVQGYSANLASWSALATSSKQDALISGTNLKTINSNSILGSGNIPLVSGTATIAIVAALPGSPDANTIYFVTG